MELQDEELLSQEDKIKLERMKFLGVILRKYTNIPPALELKDIALCITEELGDGIVDFIKEANKLKTKV